jgi:phosphoribosylaminoimidazole-succinocarboxamide synthase
MPLRDIELQLPDRRAGKVRVSWALPNDRRIIVTTDRLSAFDRVVAVVPRKGQVLNQLSAWWFDNTRDIIDNHFIAMPEPHSMIVTAATPLPVEVVVRGALTGSTSTALLTQYLAGHRMMYGHQFADGLAPHSALPEPIITPTTKAQDGGHDEPITSHDVVVRGLVETAIWQQVCSAALALYSRGCEVAAGVGLVLADTKYEFGIDSEGRVLLIDELHTPDSSRFWVAATLAERLAQGREPESLDKEPVRIALAAAGYRGSGTPPELPVDVITATSVRYVDAYERITGNAFVPAGDPTPDELLNTLREVV